MGDTRREDIGTKIIVNIGTSAETMFEAKINYQKPSGVIGSWTATIGTDVNTITYTTISGDLDDIGVWLIQGVIEYPDGTWSTTQGSFFVDNIIGGKNGQ